MIGSRVTSEQLNPIMSKEGAFAAVWRKVSLHGCVDYAKVRYGQQRLSSPASYKFNWFITLVPIC
jgi:hypothetical protein